MGITQVDYSLYKITFIQFSIERTIVIIDE